MRNDNSRFVTEIPLQVTAAQEKQLLSRFEAARQVYNACLGEALRRLETLRASEAYQLALTMPKGKERSKAFWKAAKHSKLTEYDMYAYTQQFNRAWLARHLDSRVNRKLAKRAFDAVNRWRFGINKPCKRGRCSKPPHKRYCAMCGKPRFKRYGEINSVEGSNNIQSIRWKDDRVVWNSSERHTLELPGIVDKGNPVIGHGLASPIRYVRLLRKIIKGRNRFYAQLVCEGLPLKRLEIGIGDVGLDLGPSTVAIVSEHGEVMLVQFCAELEDKAKKIRHVQRKLDRQRRANNPDNYNPDGTIKKGPKSWHISNRQRQTEIKLQELHRKQAEHRKSLHGQLVNQIFRMGNVVKMEKLSYRAFQRRFGKSVAKRAPGTFVERLRKRAEALGGVVVEFPTYHTRLSQFDHTSGEFHKDWSDLSVREKTLADGTVVQRDVYSAFLAMCIDADKHALDADLTERRWSGGGSPLRAAFSVVLGDIQEVSGSERPASFGPRRRQNLSSVNQCEAR